MKRIGQARATPLFCLENWKENLSLFDKLEVDLFQNWFVFLDVALDGPEKLQSFKDRHPGGESLAFQ